MKERENLIGRRFGRLVVKEKVENDSEGNAQYLCDCDCKNTIIVTEKSLLDKSVRNCGCFNKTALQDDYSAFHNERAFKVWRYMINRCYNPTSDPYKYYGARGITVCDEWRDDYLKFREFLYNNGYDDQAPFGECTLDRVDNDKGYSPENCRLVPMRIQALNKTNNHRIDYKGEFITVTEAAERNNLKNGQVFKRLDKGWSMDKALHQPLRETSTYTAGGEIHTILEWAEIMNVSPHVIRGRLRTQSMQEIYDDWKANGKLEINDLAPKYETANGEEHNRKEWSQIIGITETTLRKLLKTYTMQEIFNEWKAHDGRLTLIRSNQLEEADGRSLTRNEWAQELGMATKTLRKLLKERTMQDIMDEYNKSGFIKMYSVGYTYYTADGVTECLAGWARRLKVNECTLKNFLKKKTMQEIVDEYNKNGYLKVNDCSPKFHSVDGVTHGQKEWGKLIGINNSTLRYKLKKKTMQEIVDDLRASGKIINF